MADLNKSIQQIIICDTNILILMYLFKSSLMLENGAYTFGKIRVHRIAIEEIDRWIARPNGAKAKKYTLPVLKGLREKCVVHEGGYDEPSQEEFEKSSRLYQIYESSLDGSEKGNDTSMEDRLLLAAVYKNKCLIATQEKTLSALAKRYLGEPRLITFGKMVTDLFHAGQLTEQELDAGLDNLSCFKELLPSDCRARIQSCRKQS